MTNATSIVCCCGRVSRAQIAAAIRAGATTLKKVQEATGTGVGDRCKELNPKGVCCIPDIREILKEVAGSTADGGCTCPHCGPRRG
jgi:bacterioferritin-associated ferredoxin